MCDLNIPKEINPETYFKKGLKQYQLETPEANDINIDLSIADLAMSQREQQRRMFNYSCLPNTER